MNNEIEIHGSQMDLTFPYHSLSLGHWSGIFVDSVRISFEMGMIQIPSLVLLFLGIRLFGLIEIGISLSHYSTLLVQWKVSWQFFIFNLIGRNIFGWDRGR